MANNELMISDMFFLETKLDAYSSTHAVSNLMRVHCNWNECKDFHKFIPVI